MSNFGNGITITSGFDLGAKSPLDSRIVVDTINELNEHISGNRAYDGMLVYVKETKKNYQYNGTNWNEFGTLDSQSVKVSYQPSYIAGYYISYTNGRTNSQSQSYMASDYVELSENIIRFHIDGLNYNANDAAGLMFYDKNYNFIVGKGYQYNYETNLVIDKPETAKFVRFTIKSNAVNGASVYGEAVFSSAVGDIMDKLDNLDNQIDIDYCQIFHKIGGIGDSLMSGELGYYNSEGKREYIDCPNYSWLSNLCKNIGAEAVHYSRGGLTTKTWLERKLSEMKAETVLPSAYYIALGTNDATSSNPVTLGTIDDRGTDNATFYGYYSKIINEIQSFNPNAKIFCCSLYYYNSTTQETVENYSNAIKELSDTYSNCYFVDFLSNYGSQYYNNTQFMSVSHFTTPGYVKVAKEIQNLTNKVIANNPTDFSFIGREYIDLP